MACELETKACSGHDFLSTTFGLGKPKVRCDFSKREVLKLTDHTREVATPEDVCRIACFLGEDRGVIPKAERNYIFVTELGHRLNKAPCWMSGCKSLIIMHRMLDKGPKEFLHALSAQRQYLTVDMKGLAWILVPKYRPYYDFVGHYAKYMNDLVSFQTLMDPFSFFSLGSKEISSVCECDDVCPSTMKLAGQTLAVEAQRKLSMLIASRVDGALALLKTLVAFPFEDDTRMFREPVLLHALSMMLTDSRRLFFFLSKIFLYRMQETTVFFVDMFEAWAHRFETFELLSAELSIFYAKIRALELFDKPMPTIRAMPRGILERIREIVRRAKESGIEILDLRESLEFEVENLPDVLKREPNTPHGSDTSADTLNHLLSPSGTIPSEGSEDGAGEYHLRKKPGFDDDDSLADLMSNPAASGEQMDSLEGETEDAINLIKGNADPAIMVAANANSASAARRFHLLKDDVLGKGGFGVVMKAWDREEGNYAAVKEITVNQESLAEVFAEFRTQTAVSHDNVVRTLMFSVVGNVGRIFMEWIPAGSLHQVLKSTGAPFDERLTRKYVRDVLKGLEYLHANGIVHRDIKPSNMLLSAGGTVKLTDFGSSRVLGLINSSMKTETIVGTVPFLSPESVKGTYSNAGDIWAVGCSILEFITAKAPWSEKSNLDQIGMIFMIGNLQSPNHVPHFPDTVSEELRSFLESCFVFDYKLRPSATQLLTHPWLNVDE